MTAVVVLTDVLLIAGTGTGAYRVLRCLLLAALLRRFRRQAVFSVGTVLGAEVIPHQVPTFWRWFFLGWKRRPVREPVGPPGGLRPVVEFVTAPGQHVVFTSANNSQVDYPIGQHVPVHYDPYHPDSAEIAGERRPPRATGLVLQLCYLVALLVAMVFLTLNLPTITATT